MNRFNNIEWLPSDYQATDVIAKHTGDELFSRLDWVTLKPKTIIDLGAGVGNFTHLLQEKYPEAQVFAVDLSEKMLEQVKAATANCHVICADGERLPFKDQSVDCIFVNFLMPWIKESKTLLTECKRVLRGDGLLLVSALGIDTLKEIKPFINPATIPTLIDMHDLGDLLLNLQFSDPVLDVDYYTLVYQDAEKLLQELKATGMLFEQDSHVLEALRHQLRQQKDLEVTYEIIVAQGFAPMTREDMHGAQVTKVPLSQLRRQLQER